MSQQRKGDVDFSVDLARGVVIVSVKPPLALESARVSQELPILDFLDLSANMLLGWNQIQRDALAQLRRGQMPTAPPPGLVRTQ